MELDYKAETENLNEILSAQYGMKDVPYDIDVRPNIDYFIKYPNRKGFCSKIDETQRWRIGLNRNLLTDKESLKRTFYHEFRHLWQRVNADKYNIEQEKFCFSDGMEELFMEAEDNYVSKPLKFDKSELRIDGIKPSLFSTYTRLRAIYGKDSPEVREFFSRARKLKNRGKSSESNYRAKKEIEVHRNGVSHNDPDDACL